MQGTSTIHRIEHVQVGVGRFPLPEPQSDGSHQWSGTTIVVVQLHCADRIGIGYSYTSAATAQVIEDMLHDLVVDADPFAQRRLWESMRSRLRNIGLGGVAASAVAAVDQAVWDLAARLVDLPLHRLLGSCRDRIPVYGSGGFTSLSEEQLVDQLNGWAADGQRMVKMKVGRDPAADRERVARAARELPSGVDLLVDANGAYDPVLARRQAESFAVAGVAIFEEPIDAQDFVGLHHLRRMAPPGLGIAAGEYGYQLAWFRRLLQAEAVDLLQVDVTRCAGITGYLAAAELCRCHHLPLSSHTAPAAHRHLALACPAQVHCEWFADHVAIEEQLFEGAPRPIDGCMVADDDRPGNGLQLRPDVLLTHPPA